MKIFEMVRKDLKLFSRDFKTLTLIIFTPLVVMLILSLVFSTASEASSITGVTLGVCNLDERKFDIDLPIFKLTDLGDDCKSEAQELVQKGFLKAAVVIPQGFSKNIEEGFGSNLVLYVDNSKSQTAIVSSNAIKALVQELNADVGITFIESAWENLRALNENLKVVVSNLVLLRDELVLINEEVNAATETLASFDFSEAEDVLNTVSANVNESLLLVNSSAVAFDILEFETNTLNQTLQSVTRLLDQNCVVQQNLPQSACDNLKQVTIDLTDTLGRISIASSSGRQNLNTLTRNIEQSRSVLSNVSAQLVELEQLRLNFQKELVEFNASINSYNQQVLDTINELEATTVLLDVYTSRDPKNIVSAVSLEENFIHGEKSFFEILVPGLISILLLFLILLTASLDIVAERKKGTMARTFLSPTSIFTFLVAKVTYLLILALIELAVMLLIVFFVSKFLIITSTMIYLLILISINFVLTGIVIGCFAKSENTALLLSLVLAIPMLFLSGVFFPFEIMPTFMKFIGTNLPITLAITSLEKIMIYETFLVPLGIIKLSVYCVLLFILAYMLIKRNPTS